MNKETIGSTGTAPGHRALVAGEQWHRSDFTLEMLPHGYRPLLLDEAIVWGKDGDEYRAHCEKPQNFHWQSPYDRSGVLPGHFDFWRTNRPLPAIETPATPQQQSSYSHHRAEFAKAAMQSILANSDMLVSIRDVASSGDIEIEAVIADCAVSFADAVLLKLEGGVA